MIDSADNQNGSKLPEPRLHATFRSKGLQMHYVEWGDPLRPLMVMLHGGLEHCRAWDWLASHFARTYRVVCLDFRGHGDSDHSPGGAYSVLDGVYDVHRLMQELDAEKAIIVAHSFGGNVATRFTGLFPERVSALVTIEGLSMGAPFEPGATAVPLIEKLRRWCDSQDKYALSAPREYATVADAVERVLENDPLIPREIAEHVTAHGVRRNANGSFSWKYDGQMRSVSPVDLTREELHAIWRTIECPVLLFVGELSWASNPAKDGRLDYFQNARVVEVPGAGHNLHHHRGDFVRDAIEGFLAESRAVG